MKYFLIAFTLILAACGTSEEEKLRQQEQQLAQQPMVVQQPSQPVVVQQPSQPDNTMSNILLGAVAGNALSNITRSGNNNNFAPSYRQPPQVTNITRNVTINKPATSFRRSYSSFRSSRR